MRLLSVQDALLFRFRLIIPAFLRKFASVDNRCLIVNGKLIAFAIGCGATEYTVSDSVTEIGDYAFAVCFSLTSITIPGSVTSIGDYAFKSCESLTSVTIPDSVTEIGELAFYYCSSLTSFYGIFASVDNRCLIANGKLIAFAPAGLTEYTIPDSVTEIGEWVFSYCNKLTNITISDSVTKIGEWAFQECTSLTSVTIPGSVTEIGVGAFQQCISLTSVTIGNSVTSIGEWAFCDCNKLTNITIPDSVTSIGYGAFEECESLTSVYCKPTTPPAALFYEDWYAFYNNAPDRKIYVPAESYYDYIGAEGWRDYADYIVAYDFEKGEVVGVEKPEPGNPDEIENNQIWYTSYGGEVSIRPEAFNAAIVSNICYGDYGVITFDEELTTIGDFAFAGANNLCTLTLPGSVVSVGECIVKDCNSISRFMGKFATEDGSALIANGVFVACAQSTVAEEYIIPDGVTRIATCAFRECENISKIVIPQSVESIGEGAFSSSLGIQSFEGKFVTDDSLAVICDNTLIGYAHGNPNRSYAIPEGVTRIGWYALDNSIYLEEVTIPETVTEIGDVSFAFCYSLQRVYCKPTTPPIAILDDNMDWEAFSYNGYQMQIYVPAESYQDYISAEGWSQYAASILPYDYDNNCVVEVDPSEETKRWLGKWSSTVSRTYCPQTGFNEETVNFEVSIAHDGVLPNAVKIYGLSVIDPTIAVDGVVNANGDLEILNFNYIGNSGEWGLYVWALSEAMSLSFDRHAVYTMSMDEGGNVSCKVGSLEGSPYIMFDIFGYNVNTGNVSWYNTNISYYSGPMSWVKMADNGATPSRSLQKISYRHNLHPQADARLRVVE